MGGPRRDYFTNLVVELKDKLKLLIKSPNAVHNVGEEREKLIPNPKATSLTDQRNYFKLGMLLAISYKMMECLELDLPSCFWKQFYGTKALTQARG